MNLFGLYQSFMGCMYPGSIRTESIESMDNEHPDCRFAVANIDEHGYEVSRGELQLTDKDLIYFRPSKFPTRWPLCFIRRYGCNEQGDIFVFECGRRCPTGQAIFAFRLIRGNDLLGRLKERIDRTPQYDNTNEPYSNLNRQANSNSARPPSSNSYRQFFPKNSNQKVPFTLDQSQSQAKKDASTSTDNPTIDADLMVDNEYADPKPLSYALIDFDTTKALNESAQAHAANRVR